MNRFAVLSVLLMSATVISGGEIVRDVVEDTWIEDLTSTMPHGSDLAVAICPTGNYWIYVKFDVSSLPGDVSDAELRLTRFNGDRPDEISVYLITDDSWSEATLTGVNRPAPTSPPNSAALATGQVATGHDRWTSVDLTTAIIGEVEGDGTLTLMLREDPAPMLDIRYYRSREASVPAAEKPRLVINCTTAEVSAIVATSTSPTTLDWGDGAGSTWDVAGGTLSDLRADGGVQGASCLANDSVMSSYSDPRPDPVAGDGYYYIVRANGACGTGGYGFAAGDVERLPVASCP